MFIIGVIYAYNKDNHDFRYLHEQEELQGNESSFEEAVSLVSLAFKRKVFFMDFNLKFSFWTLVRLYMMLVHPLFAIKYKMDPHIPRFYRFLNLFTRINIAFLLTFFVQRNYQNPDRSGEGLASMIIFIIFGSLLYIPLPVSLYDPFKSRFFLLKSQKDVSENNEKRKRVAIDFDNNNFKDGELDDIEQAYIDELDERVSEV